ISQVAPGTITANALGAISVTGSVVLGTLANSVTTFSASAAGSVSYTDTDAVTIDQVAAAPLFAGAAGITANVATGIVRLRVGGTIDQPAAGVITGSALGAQVTAGNVALGTATNNVTTFAAATAGGSVTYKDADALTIGTVGPLGLFVNTVGVQTGGG